MRIKRTRIPLGLPGIVDLLIVALLAQNFLRRGAHHPRVEGGRQSEVSECKAALRPHPQARPLLLVIRLDAGSCHQGP